MIALLVTLLIFTITGAAFAGLSKQVVRGTAGELWAELFLRGVAAAGLLLFALALVHVSLSRLTVAGIILVATALAAWRRPRLQLERNQGWLFVALVFLPLLLLAADAAVLPLHDFDGRSFWIPKARAIASEQKIDGPFFQGESSYHAHSHYPLLLPLDAAAVLISVGDLDDRHVRWLYLLIALALALITRNRLRAVTTTLFASAGAAVLFWLPQLTIEPDGGATSAYGDLAVAAFVTLLFYDLLKRDDDQSSNAPLWIAALMFTKNEGLPLAMIFLCVYATRVVLHRSRREVVRFALSSSSALLTFGALILWRARIPLLNDENYASLLRNLGERIALFDDAARELLTRLADFRQWGIFWLVVIAAVLLMLARRDRRILLPGFIMTAALFVYSVAYTVTSWNLHDLAGASANRLLSHLVAPALYLAVIAFTEGAALAPPSRDEMQSSAASLS
jgi:hypothetical protein